MFNKLAFLVFCILTLPLFAGPVLVTYQATDLGSNRWQYEYSVTNNSFSQGISELTLWFDYDYYDNIAIETTNVSQGFWDEIVSQPHYIPPFDPYNGMYDALALQENIALGQTVSGFTISFDWLGNGLPISQDYQIIDPKTFETIFQGETIGNMVNIIPAPGALLLGVIGLGIVRFNKKYSL